MARFRVKKDGKLVGALEGTDARNLGMVAVERWGYGTYDIRMIRGSDDGVRRYGYDHDEDDDE